MQSPMNVKIGRFYRVPCVEIEPRYWVPVLLPAHEDGKENCFRKTEKHYHIDFRFDEYNSKIIIFPYEKCRPVSLKKLKALREKLDPFELTSDSAFFFINRWYRRKKSLGLKDGRCPHRGLQVVNECGTCPGHGLIWDLKTNQLIDVTLPFFLELANQEIPNPNNPRGEITEDDQCEIKIKHPFDHDGTIIMVDATGKRYGKGKQITKPKRLSPGDSIRFHANLICD